MAISIRYQQEREEENGLNKKYQMAKTGFSGKNKVTDNYILNSNTGYTNKSLRYKTHIKCVQTEVEKHKSRVLKV